ncbi:hypothetical protein L284_15575 [Novosphingobium lindaniclasticum LE124]|uniref:Uncharacterized protein n=1 Tax=Novosphingobium lindaniclasticum LE124 TaxID=1096930 RepID=T0IRH9_9SPHN|nr:hypothetical protein L284_15575 [Novosphingobium lindaniclasticum LE124]
MQVFILLLKFSNKLFRFPIFNQMTKTDARKKRPF